MTTLLTQTMIDDLTVFASATADAWISSGLVKPNSWGVEVMAVSPGIGSTWNTANVYTFGETRQGVPHPKEWYIANATGKNKICMVTGMDSHEAVRLWSGRVRHIQGAFPWGGAVIDSAYGLIIGTSGFKEDEDILFSRTLRNRLVMQLDREGDLILGDARERGEQEGDAGADRFTVAVDMVR